jgi:hypothetical protein
LCEEEGRLFSCGLGHQASSEENAARRSRRHRESSQ